MAVDKQNLYECIFIARQDIPAQDVHKLADKFVSLFEEHGTSLVKREYWGLRPLAYEIKKNKKGHYVYLGLKGNSAAVKEFERNCKINEDVLKYLSLRVDAIEEGASIMMQAPAKASHTAASSNDEI